MGGLILQGPKAEASFPAPGAGDLHLQTIAPAGCRATLDELLA